MLSSLFIGEIFLVNAVSQIFVTKNGGFVFLVTGNSNFMRLMKLKLPEWFSVFCFFFHFFIIGSINTLKAQST